MSERTLAPAGEIALRLDETLATLGLVCTTLACVALLLLYALPGPLAMAPAAAPGWRGLLQGYIYLASMPPLPLVGSFFCLTAILHGRRHGQAGWRRAALGLGLGVVALGYWITLLVWLMATSGA